MVATLILTSCPTHPTTLLILLQVERPLHRNAWIYTRQKTVAIWENALHSWYCSIPRLKSSGNRILATKSRTLHRNIGTGSQKRSPNTCGEPISGYAFYNNRVFSRQCTNP